MAVRIDRVPLPMAEPGSPRLWLWLLLLLVALLLGLGLTLWLGNGAFTEQPERFWLVALGCPLLLWCLLVVLRVLAYVGEAGVANGWNEAREADLTQKMRQGRRSQQVLAVSLHTAHRDPAASDGQAQLSALLGDDDSAFRAQSAWNGSSERHSRLLLLDNERADQLLCRMLSAVLADLAGTLAKLPTERPLALLLNVDSSVDESVLQKAWQQAWAASGISQPITLLEGSGLSVVDHWLDQRIRDQALLLVIALRVAPTEAEGSAEAAVGLLFGNRLTQTALEPLAYLHRPEPARTATVEEALRASRQALDWVPLPALSIGHAWQTAMGVERASAITAVRDDLQMSVKKGAGLHDLDDLLGNPGCAAPWVAIAAAVESIRHEAAAHFIFSGDNAPDAWLWCSAVTPFKQPGK